MERLIVNGNGSSSELSFIDDNDAAQQIRTSNSEKSSEMSRDRDGSTGAYSKHSKRIPRVSIPGDFDFIDDLNPSPLSCGDVPLSLQNGVEPEPVPTKTLSSNSPVIFKIPSIYLPSNLQYIDDEVVSQAKSRALIRGRDTHSSLKVPRRHSAKRHLCRHHSDSETKGSKVSESKPRHHRGRSRRVRRSISAIETQKDGYHPRVRRSVSDRSGMVVAGKHLLPPRGFRPHSHYENGSSRCSSTRTLSTNVSISEIVAVEMGIKDIPGLTAKEARRRRIVCTVVVVSVTILVICILLLAVTLLLSPEVDALCKSNSSFYLTLYFTL